MLNQLRVAAWLCCGADLTSHGNSPIHPDVTSLDDSLPLTDGASTYSPSATPFSFPSHFRPHPRRSPHMAPTKSKMKLRILLVGGGGREHALAWKLAQSDRVEAIHVVPGNGGTVG